MNENTLSSNLERIKNAVDDIRTAVNEPTGTIEAVADAVEGVIPTGNKEIVENGTNIDVAHYSTVSVDVPTGGGSADVSEFLKGVTLISFNGQNTEPEGLPSGTLYLPAINNAESMFASAGFYRNIQTSNNKAVSISSMYYNNKSVTQVDLSGITFVQYSQRAVFKNCTNLTRVDLNKDWTFYEPNDRHYIYDIFYNCTSLQHVPFDRFKFNNCMLDPQSSFYNVDPSKLDEESRNALLLMFANQTYTPTSFKSLDKFFNVSFDDNLFTGLSNYSTFTSAGWTLRKTFVKLVLSQGDNLPKNFSIKKDLTSEQLPVSGSLNAYGPYYTLDIYTDLDASGSGNIQITINPDDPSGYMEQTYLEVSYQDGVVQNYYSNGDLLYYQDLTDSLVVTLLDDDISISSVSGDLELYQ